MSKIRVLLIDDDQTARRGLARYLRTVADFEVTECDSGAKAIEHLGTTRQDYTAVLLDFVLTPNMSGDQVLVEIRNRYPRLPVIVFTGLNHRGGVQTLERGAYRYMPRPINYEELTSIIRNLAEQNMVFYEMARDVRRILGSDMCIAWRLGRRKRQFRVVAWHGDKELDEEYRQTVFLNLDDPATRKFFAKGMPIYLRDVKDPDSAPNYRYRQHASDRGWTSLVSIPLVRQKRVIGLIDSYTYKCLEIADREQDRLLKVILPAFAHQAAEAIRNAELSDQLQTLQGINQILAGTFEEKTIIRQILSKGLELIGADSGWLYFVDTNAGKLVLKDWLGVIDELVEHERNLGEGVTGWVAQEGRVLNVPNVSREPLHKALPGLEVKSEVAVPLRREEQTIGVLTAQSRFLDAFTDDDVNLLMALAAQAAITIGRASMTRHLQRVSQLALAGSYEDLANYVVEAVHDLTGADVILWMVSDGEGERGECLRIVAGRGGFDEKYRLEASIPIVTGSSITMLAWERGEPVIRRDILADVEEPKFHNLKEAKRQGWHSFIAAPLLGRERKRLGSLSLYSKEVAKFGEAEAELMRTFANQVAMAFESQARQRSLEHLVQSGQITIEQISDESKVLQQFVEQARQLTGAPCAVIYPYDPEQKRLFDKERVVASGLLGKKKEVTDKPRGKGLAAIIRHTGSIVVHDLTAGEIGEIDFSSVPEPLDREKMLQIIRGEKFIKREKVKAFVGLSLRAAGYGGTGASQEEVGVLYINYRTSHRFTSSELSLIQLGSQQVANLIRAARLWARLREQLGMSQTLVEASQAIDQSIQWDDVLRTVFRQAFAFVGQTTGLVMSVELDRRLRIVDSEGVSQEQTDFFHNRPTYAHEGSFGIVVRTGEWFESLDTRKDLKEGRMVDFGLPIPPQLTNIPLKCEGNVAGILVLDTVAPNQQVRAALLALADIAGIALERAGLFDTLRERTQVLSDLYKAGQVLASAPDLNSVLTSVVEKAQAILRADAVVLYQYDSEKDDILVSPIFQGVNEPSILQQVGEFHRDSVAMKIVRLGHSLYAPCSKDDDILSNPDRPADAVPTFVAREGIASSAGVLLQATGEIVGVLFINYRTPHDFDGREKEKIELFANQAALAIQNARRRVRLQEELQQTRALYAVGQAISQELAYKSVLQLILEQASGIIPFKHASITLVAEYSQRLVMESSIGLPEGIDRIRTQIGEGITGWVAKHGCSLLVDDVQNIPEVPGVPEQPGYILLAPDTRSELCVPLKIKDEVIGVINVESPKIRAFDKTDQTQLEMMASQAAISIKNAVLYNDIQTKAQQLIRLHQVLDATTRTLDYKKALSLLVESADKVLGAESSSAIHLYDSDKKKFTAYCTAGPRKALLEKEGLPRPKKGISLTVIRSGEPMFVDDAASHPLVRPQAIRQGLKSFACLPLPVGDKVTGTLYIRFDTPHYFSEDEQLILELFANQAAVTLQNARLFTESETLKKRIEKQRIAELEALDKLGKELAALEQKD